MRADEEMGMFVATGAPWALRHWAQWHTWMGGRGGVMLKLTAAQRQEPVTAGDEGAEVDVDAVELDVGGWGWCWDVEAELDAAGIARAAWSDGDACSGCMSE